MRNPNTLMGLMLALVLLTLPLLVACGDDDETAEPTPTAQPTATVEPTATAQPTAAVEPTPPEPAETVKITIGNISDLTGPAAQAVSIVDAGFQDIIQYFNEEGLIPGVEVEMVSWDGQYDPSRDIPGYEWLKERGADLIIGSLPPTPVTLKPFLDDDEMVMLPMGSREEGYMPPGYVFTMNASTECYVPTLLKWIAENDWDYEADGPAKIGIAGWVGPYQEALATSMHEYSDAHPDQFEVVGEYLAPFAMTFPAAVEGLKECDYVIPPSTGIALPNFVNEFRQAGGTAKLIGTDAHPAFYGLALEGAGWDNLDGMLHIAAIPWWNETEIEIVNLVHELLDRYHGSPDEFMYAGTSYMSAVQFLYGALLAIGETVETVGAENFSSPALHDTLMSFEWVMDGPQVWGFGETKRTNWSSFAIYEWNASAQDIVRKDASWIPIQCGP